MLIRADRTQNGEFDIAIEFSQNDDMNALYEDLFSGAIESALLDSIITVRNFRTSHSPNEIRKFIRYKHQGHSGSLSLVIVQSFFRKSLNF